jgi:hypothetical protein
MDYYYYLDRNRQQQGPVAASELPRYGVTRNTQVWREGMAGWQPAGSISELAEIFYVPAPPPPAPAPSPYAYQAPSETPKKPDNYLAWSILATVFCCLIGGIFAIVYSSRVDKLWADGDYEGSRIASKKASNWCIASAVLMFVFWIIYLIWFFIFGVSVLGALS